MILLWAVLLLIAGLQIPSMVKNKDYNLLLVYVILWLAAGIYSSLIVLRAPIPNPTDIILYIHDYIVSNILQL